MGELQKSNSNLLSFFQVSESGLESNQVIAVLAVEDVTVGNDELSRALTPLVLEFVKKNDRLSIRPATFFVTRKHLNFRDHPVYKISPNGQKVLLQMNGSYSIYRFVFNLEKVQTCVSNHH
jgi:hypothetical protein